MPVQLWHIYDTAIEICTVFWAKNRSVSGVDCGYPLECYDFCYNRERKKVFCPQGDLGYPQGITTVLEVYYIILGIDVHLFVMF